MNHDLTEIIFLLDRSGSMQGLEKDTIGGYNGFINSQVELGETRITTVLFDDKYELLFDGVSAEKAVITEKEYFVRGGTALLDAIGKTILDVGHRLSNTDEADRPGKIIFVITTDGMENRSQEFKYPQIRDMITHQTEKYSWEFIFMGANIDVAAESAKLGVSMMNTMAYEASSSGTGEMYASVNRMAAKMRKGS
jgi:uncharacterized protein YegL